MDQAFDAVFEADKETKGGDSRDVSFERLANEGQHVLAFLEVVRFPFGFDGNAFPRACLIGGHGMERQGLLGFFPPAVCPDADTGGSGGGPRGPGSGGSAT